MFKWVLWIIRKWAIFPVYQKDNIFHMCSPLTLKKKKRMSLFPGKIPITIAAKQTSSDSISLSNQLTISPVPCGWRIKIGHSKDCIGSAPGSLWHLEPPGGCPTLLPGTWAKVSCRAEPLTKHLQVGFLRVGLLPRSSDPGDSNAGAPGDRAKSVLPVMACSATSTMLSALVITAKSPPRLEAKGLPPAEGKWQVT